MRAEFFDYAVKREQSRCKREQGAVKRKSIAVTGVLALDNPQSARVCSGLRQQSRICKTVLLYGICQQGRFISMFAEILAGLPGDGMKF